MMLCDIPARIAGKLFRKKNGFFNLETNTLQGEIYYPDNAFNILYLSEEKNF